MDMPQHESFYGFDMIDSEVGPGSFRNLALEMKHLFEKIAMDADESSEEIFIIPDLELALRRLLVDPCEESLIELLEISPTLIDSVCIFCSASNLVVAELLNSAGASHQPTKGTREARLLARLLYLSPIAITPKPGYRLLPSGVHSLLRMAIRSMLEKNFRRNFPAHSELLSNAIIKLILDEEPCNEDLVNYLAENTNLVQRQACNIHLDLPLAHAFSILVSFSLVQLGPKYPEKSFALVERMTEFQLILRGTYEMVPTHDHREWLDGVQLFGQTLLRENSPSRLCGS